MKNTLNEELRDLAERLLAVAESSITVKKRVEIGSSEVILHSELDDNVLASYAELELKRRAERVDYLPANLFGEGGWSILLDLFVSEQRDRKVTVSSACIASSSPSTTALRQIAVLIELGLVKRTKCDLDGRTSYINLTDRGRSSMRSVLTLYDQ